MKKIIYVFFFTAISFFPACNSDSNPISSLSEVPKDFNEAIFSGYYGGYDFSTDNQGNIYHSSSYTDSITLGNIKLSGGDTYNSYLAKYNQTGAVVWAVALEHATIRQIKANNKGDLVVVGGFSGVLKIGDMSIPSAGSSDIFMTKFNSDGKLLWLKSIGAEKWDEANSVAFDQTGNILLTGRFDGKVLFDNVLLNSGYENDNYAQHSDIFIASYNSVGQLNWAKQGGSASIDIAFGVCTDIDNNVVITGQVYTDATPAVFNEVILQAYNYIFVAKYDKNGNQLWAESFGNYSGDMGTGIVTDANNSIYITGLFGGSAKFGDFTLTPKKQIDIFIVKLSDSGKVQWANQSSIITGANTYYIRTNGSSNLYFSGSFQGTADFGTTTLSTEEQGIFIVNFNTDGNLLWAKKYEFNY